MRDLKFAAVGLSIVLYLQDQQQLKRKQPKNQLRKAAAPTAPAKILPPLDVRAAREKADNQLSNVNDFANKLATIAQGLEVADADAKAGRLKPATAAKITAKKGELVEAIRNIKVVLGNLESEFRTKAVLENTFQPSRE